MGISVTPLSEVLGAEIGGVDVSGAIDDATMAEIETAFHDHSVLLFPKQDLTPAQHISFSRRFGPLETHVSKQYLLSGHQEILVLSNERNQDGSRVSIADGGVGWHSDLSYMERPAMGSLLYAVDAPDVPGVVQDTAWSSGYLAYESLPEDLKQRIQGLKAIHVFDQDRNPRMPPIDTRYRDKHTPAMRALTPPREHPIVRIHPVTGRKALFVSIRFTIGIAEMEGAEGDALLDALFAHQAEGGFNYLHQWRKGDLILWDNRCTNHRAVGEIAEPPHIRRMHRTTLSGDIPY
ncbi:MAG: TauD/TfdA family dioxygenase [Rhodospirillales bacterium]|nr:TauD/TfdA family dioxygenase [Rhodospirillales bacterium]